MTESEKFNLLVNFQCGKAKARITTIRGDVYHCRLLGQCEDTDDWAYEFYSPDYPTKFFALNCDFIESIKEISDEEWQRHLAAKEKVNT